MIADKPGLLDQGDYILAELAKISSDLKLSGIFCVAGGWAGGNAASDDLLKNTDLMIKQSIWTSMIAAHVASKHLKEYVL